MMNDVFTPSAFTLSSLTAQINNLVYAPMRLSGLFEESGIATTSAAIDIEDGVLSLVDVAPRVPADPDILFYGHWLETAHMLRVIRGEEEPIIRREEVLNTIRALEALYHSSDLGREIVLD